MCNLHKFIKIFYFNKMDKVIGVLGFDNTRSQTDNRYLSQFSCDRQRNINYISGDGSGVLGNANETRSVRDMQMIKDFSCSKENYRSDQKIAVMLEPRSVKDMAMLREYNPTLCTEGYMQRGGHMGQSAKVQYMQNGGPFENYECPYAQMNYNPYNSSTNVKFVPLM